ncbi:MAG TPA: MFS transporter [Phototrophicaceae bacterium]|nr:MFS transporter [Phototrophicaceae bacterium]
MREKWRAGLRTIIVSYLGFIGLGMTGGLLGLAWPTIHREFNVSLDAIGILLLASTIGYLSASFFSGPIAYRIGAGRMLAAASAFSGLGLLAFSLNHSWILFPVVMLLSGFGFGAIDAGINAYVAQHHGVRAMNWLHGSFGIGTTIGPLIMRQVLTSGQAWPDGAVEPLLLRQVLETSGQSWRAGYVIVGAIMLVIALLFTLTQSWWLGVIVENETTNAQRKSALDVLKMPAVWFGIALFFLYAGLEATPGTWIYTLFTEARGISVEAAGLWVSIYWGSFTIGRFLFGAIIPYVNTISLSRVLMVGVVGGALLLWWSPTPALGFIGLTLIGFMEAPLFPMFVSDTPKRVGMENAGNAIGFQVSGAGFGVSMLPALAGLLSAHISLNVIPPFMAIAAVLVIIVHEISVAWGRHLTRLATASVRS